MSLSKNINFTSRVSECNFSFLKNSEQINSEELLLHFSAVRDKNEAKRLILVCIEPLASFVCLFKEKNIGPLA